MFKESICILFYVRYVRLCLNIKSCFILISCFRDRRLKVMKEIAVDTFWERRIAIYHVNNKQFFIYCWVRHLKGHVYNLCYARRLFGWIFDLERTLKGQNFTNSWVNVSTLYLIDKSECTKVPYRLYLITR